MRAKIGNYVNVICEMIAKTGQTIALHPLFHFFIVVVENINECVFLFGLSVEAVFNGFYCDFNAQTFKYIELSLDLCFEACEVVV